MVSFGLQSADKISITFDVWRSDSIESYLGVTAHYVEQSNLESRLLSLDYIETNHTSEELYKKLNQIFDSYNISNKV
jgi:hypothetical protein